MIIAVSGIDGSGKTLLAESLANELRTTHAVTVVNEFEFPVLKKIKSILVRSTASAVTGRQSRYPGYVPYLVWAELVFQYLSYKLRPKEIFILDRSFIDYLVTWRELKQSNKIIEFLYLQAAAASSLHFFINTSPAKALQRRQLQPDRNADNYEFYATKHALYKFMDSMQGVYVIDNNREATASLREMHAAVRHAVALRSIKCIAVSGLDGSGKSTCITELSTELQRLNIRHTRCHFYYNYIIIKLLRKLRPDNSPSSLQHARSLDTELSARVNRKSRLWVMFVLADAFMQFVFMRATRMGRIIIFDRFFHDYLVSFRFINAPHDPRLLMRLFPHPGAYFMLTAPAKTLHARKPEHTLIFFHECAQEYKSLSAAVDITPIDSAKNTPHQVVNELLESLSDEL